MSDPVDATWPPPEGTTWDGIPVAKGPPYGASIVVYRSIGSHVEYLVLHRQHLGTDYEGDWAWGPPGGARLPGESVEECATRELAEEAGLDVPLTRTNFGTASWAVFMVEVDDAEIALSPEHDRYRWVDAEEAVSVCLPQVVAGPFISVQSTLGEPMSRRKR